MIKDIFYWLYSEFMATFKPEPYIHICQNYRFRFGLPMRWHKKYIQFAKDSKVKVCCDKPECVISAIYESKR